MIKIVAPAAFIVIGMAIERSVASGDGYVILWSALAVLNLVMYWISSEK